MSTFGHLTALQLAALALYAERPRHPYEVFQEMARRGEDRLVKVRPGTLYHAINRLAEGGLLVEQGVDREGSRPERTTYAITATGRDALVHHLAAMLQRRAEEFPEFPLAVAEIANLEPRHAGDLLTRRAGELRAQLALLEDQRRVVTDMDLPEALWLEVGWLESMTRADLSWTEATILRLRTGELVWAPDQLAEHASAPTSSMPSAAKESHD